MFLKMSIYAASVQLGLLAALVCAMCGFRRATSNSVPTLICWPGWGRRQVGGNQAEAGKQLSGVAPRRDNDAAGFAP